MIEIFSKKSSQKKNLLKRNLLKGNILKRNFLKKNLLKRNLLKRNLLKRNLHCNPLQGNYRVELLHREITVVITGNEFTEYNPV